MELPQKTIRGSEPRARPGRQISLYNGACTKISDTKAIRCSFAKYCEVERECVLTNFRFGKARILCGSEQTTRGPGRRLSRPGCTISAFRRSRLWNSVFFFEDKTCCQRTLKHVTGHKSEKQMRRDYRGPWCIRSMQRVEHLMACEVGDLHCEPPDPRHPPDVQVRDR